MSQKQQLYIGTMSGTSMDGLDLVAAEFINNRPQLRFKDCIQYPFELRNALQELAQNANGTINEMCRLDTLLGQFYADTINNFITHNSLDKQQVVAIGSHGQTLRHTIQSDAPFTLQIGDPNIIAAKTGITVVADFRRRDLALGGQGAPLAPAFHNQVFRTEKANRVIINIGGIANITFLPADISLPVSGFDTGPGNTLLDLISRKFMDRNYDANGAIAAGGKVHRPTLERMLQKEPYFRQTPPKSTGTDYFSADWLKSFQAENLPVEDILATLVELTAISINNAIKSLPAAIDECYVCGGGSHNTYLMERLQLHLQPAKAGTTADLNIHPDWVEALAFSWLARQTMTGQPGNLPSVTNAEQFTILGAVYFSHGNFKSIC